jgi:hypothetical protein
MLPLTRSRNRQRFFGNGWNPFSQLGSTLNLDFINEVYEIFEYGPLDASLNLDFVNQIYQSE